MRRLTYTAHCPHPINFFDDVFRLPRHFDVLKASMVAAAELGAIHYVVHASVMPLVQAAGLEAAYEHQREWLTRGGDLAKSLAPKIFPPRATSILRDRPHVDRL
ncbi:MAG: hypothetical protein FJX04_10210 [Alphaproteobacteria bacterium]|nr:hypothetical protein [Alphaproteobacteria bacterium]